MTDRKVVEMHKPEPELEPEKRDGFLRRMFTEPVPEPPTRVNFTLLDVPFWNLVGFLVKLFFAALVAGIAIALIGVIIAFIILAALT